MRTCYLAAVLMLLIPYGAIAKAQTSPEAIVTISPDASAGTQSVWAITKSGRLLWCRTGAQGIQCIGHADGTQQFSELAERVGTGGSSVWALSRDGALFWCRPEGMDAVACYR